MPQRESCTCVPGHMYKNVDSSFFCNKPKMGIILCSSTRKEINSGIFIQWNTIQQWEWTNYNVVIDESHKENIKQKKKKEYNEFPFIFIF